MKAIAVHPGTPDTLHLRDIPTPDINSVPNGRGVLVKVLQVGVDATDQEINEALYGNSPEGDDYLVIGHEVFGRVEEVGPNVTHVQPGDYVACTVRRPGDSIYDRIGRSDITSDETYYERGINLLHGFMTEYFVDDAEFVVRYPEQLKKLGVLSEPASVCAKAIQQAYSAQQRLQVWEPKRAWVMGAGQIGLLATMMLKLRRLEVCTIARSPAEGNLKAEIAEQFGANYVSTKEQSLEDVAEKYGRPDLIIEATGNSRVAFECMDVLNLNGALVLTSVTGGSRRTEIESDRINLEWVLGNKMLLGSVNGNFRHFQEGVSAMALGEAMYPGVLERILTHPVQGMDEYEKLMPLLNDSSVLKVYVEIAK
ncbi:glucose 1-dehydrogenase [Rubinisphaera brasiliensis]|uniref:Glucose 1-dehydrogenase n=1 Tax=Rubinisphaera brasiliensis (strain ATCC 49424 / DSM 5305 / JCM 21570 / IAM 15109 / NBRC 103401 / IFAM 1448) TaxID=756272 RepID=F0SH31_RUBBR|nr:glucose 1-dehydrogenase [Rubinisphaera brasiliensis]ADY59516.1 glucose 1-dehydrogenase [Rubinisphaera brasiliensis DSM 5305]